MLADPAIPSLLMSTNKVCNPYLSSVGTPSHPFGQFLAHLHMFGHHFRHSFSLVSNFIVAQLHSGSMVQVCKEVPMDSLAHCHDGFGWI